MISRRLLFAGRGSGTFTPPAPPEWTRGSLTADGAPVTVQADGQHNAFPGITWLDATRCLLVWRRGTGHLEDGEIYGSIGTVSGTVVTWGSAFLIHTDAEDIRLEDAVSVIDGYAVILARLYDTVVNHDPFLLICDDLATSMTSSSSWTEVAVPIAEGSGHNSGIGRVLKTQAGTYLVGYNSTSGSNTENGVFRSTALDDWSGASGVTVGPSGTNPGYTEIDIEEMPDGELVAHLRTETATTQHYISTSTDDGVTWSAPASLFSAWGYPSWLRLTSGMQLTVYRQSSNFDTYWRQSDDDGATWSSETLLDATLIDGLASQSAYATFLQLDDFYVLCVYAIEQEAAFDSNLYSQVFTDSSTFG